MKKLIGVLIIGFVLYKFIDFKCNPDKYDEGYDAAYFLCECMGQTLDEELRQEIYSTALTDTSTMRDTLMVIIFERVMMEYGVKCFKEMEIKYGQSFIREETLYEGVKSYCPNLYEQLMIGKSERESVEKLIKKYSK